MKKIIIILLFLTSGLLFSQAYRTNYASKLHLSSNPESGFEYVIAAPTGLNSSFTFSLPPTLGNDGDILMSLGDGSYTWSNPSLVSTLPAGNNSQLQYALSSSFSASPNLTWNNSSNYLRVGTTSGNFNLNVGSWIGSGKNGKSGALVLHSGNVAGYKTFFTPNPNTTVSSTFTLPANDGTSGQYLITDGQGNLSWTSAAVGGNFDCIGQGSGGGTGNEATSSHAFVGGGTSNSASGNASVIGGGTANSAGGTNSGIATGSINTIDSGSNNSFIGSGANNTITGNSSQATIGAGNNNTINSGANNAFIGAGGYNLIQSPNSVIVAGYSNTISTSSNNSIIGAGSSNKIMSGMQNGILSGSNNLINGVSNSSISTGTNNTITGANSSLITGSDNSISGSNSSISSGTNNLVTGSYSGIFGGSSNTVTGSYSGAFGYQSKANADYTLALGRRAVADDQGAFIFTDNTDAELNSSSTNRLEMRFTNGYRFYTNSGLSTGMTLAAGGNSWAAVSDVNVKSNILEIDYNSFLNKISNLSITTWSYIFSEDKSKRNYGPMAQDFFKLFGNDKFGHFGSDKEIISNHITNVGFAALKGLNAEYELTKKKINELDKEQNQILEELMILEKEIDEIQNKIGDSK